MNRNPFPPPGCWLSALPALLLAVFCAAPAGAADSVCARVKIQIEQELTFEREAFEARMTINNGLPETPITDLAVTVNFADETGAPVLATSDPNNTSALFFIRLQDGSSLPSTVAASSSASIKWLIIPAPGAGGTRPQGTVYLVGAHLTYKVSGAEEQVNVSPDSIFVKPMPRLTLDYFLPSEVNGDDPFTDYIEEPEPFSLGVRIKNAGYGPAKNLKIDSSQPKIVENKQGLLVSFLLHGCTIDDQPAVPTLLADFGTIAGGTTKVGRWIMTSSLYGRFVEFTASFSHADDLGGRLTSLIEQVNARLMIHDVLVDLPGRDSVRDFLAYRLSNGTDPRAYESNGTDSPVNDLSSSSTFVSSGGAWKLTPPGVEGLLYAKVTDPNGGRRKITSVLRADGKSLPAANAWLSKTYNPGPGSYAYYFNVFDSANTTGLAYTVQFEDNILANRKPRLIDPGDRIFLAGTTFEMLVLADDPDADPLTLTAAPLPQGAAFTKVNGGVSALRWTPTAAQTGDYQVTFAASDGNLEDRKTITITVTTEPTAIAWIRRFYGPDVRPPVVIFAEDDDGDDLTNGLEYALNHNPAEIDQSGIDVRVEVNGSNQMVTTLTYIRRNDDPKLVVEVVGAGSSRAGADWQPQPQALAADQTGVPDGMQRWKATDSVPISPATPRRFLKLRASLLP
ncbi:MAG: putative Ig domain-containing protein [Verrucomicrobiota bacterium]